MKLNNLQKKLFKTALYSSPVIAVVALAPLLVIIQYHDLPPHGLTYFQYILVGVSIIAIRTFFIWIINILLFTLGIGKKYVAQRSSWFYYLVSYLLVLVFIVVVQYLFNPVGPEGYHPNQHLLNNSYGYYFWIATGLAINTVVLIIQNLILTMEKKTNVELENSRLKLRNAEAFNQKLKQQIHPHFLFNSLNTLKTLTKKDPDTATDFVVRLSGFLRSALSSTNVNTVKLSEELDLSIDYLEMQKIRFGSALGYKANIPKIVRDSGFVPPFSIQLLLENAIKHNAMSPESPLQIQILHQDGWIKVINNKQQRTKSEPSTGVGLDNLAERYQILSGDEIIIKPGEDQFLVSIKVLDHERTVYSPEEYEILSDQ